MAASYVDALLAPPKEDKAGPKPMLDEETAETTTKEPPSKKRTTEQPGETYRDRAEQGKLTMLDRRLLLTEQKAFLAPSWANERFPYPKMLKVSEAPCQVQLALKVGQVRMAPSLEAPTETTANCMLVDPTGSRTLLGCFC